MGGKGGLLWLQLS